MAAIASLRNYRTDSFPRRFLSEIVVMTERLAAKVGQDLWFKVFGSARHNTCSTLTIPDFDLACECRLGDLHDLGLQLELADACDPRDVVKRAIYYRLKFVGSKEQEELLNRHLLTSLWFLVRHHPDYRDRPNCVPWLVDRHGGRYLSASNLRILQAGIGGLVGAKNSGTGGAASAEFVVDDAAKLQKLVDDFYTLLVPKTAKNVFFGELVPNVVIPHVARERKGKSFDFDLVTILRCHPSLAGDGAPRLSARVATQSASKVGLGLVAKVDKVGLGDKDTDFQTSCSHDEYLQKVEGSRQVLVVLKDLLALLDFGEKDPELRKLDFPKSYHLKTAMALVAEEKGYGKENQPGEEELLEETIRKAISCYGCGFLPSFFDDRTNLLLDLTKTGEEWKRQAAMKRMERVLGEYPALLSECQGRPMATSSFIMGIIREILSSDLAKPSPLSLESFVLPALTFFSYDDHGRETPSEAAITTDLLEGAAEIIVSGAGSVEADEIRKQVIDYFVRTLFQR